MFSYGFVVHLPELPDMDESAHKMIGNAVSKAVNMMLEAIRKENLRGDMKVTAALAPADEVMDEDTTVPARLMIRLDAPEKGSIIIM